jgi:hypothetical protein
MGGTAAPSSVIAAHEHVWTPTQVGWYGPVPGLPLTMILACPCGAYRRVPAFEAP